MDVEFTTDRLATQMSGSPVFTSQDSGTRNSGVTTLPASGKHRSGSVEKDSRESRTPSDTVRVVAITLLPNLTNELLSSFTLHEAVSRGSLVESCTYCCRLVKKTNPLDTGQLSTDRQNEPTHWRGLHAN